MTQPICKLERSSDEGQSSVADFSEPLSDSVTLPVKPCNVTTRAQSAEGVLRELPFFGVDWEAGPVKPHKSRAQRRQEKLKGSLRQGAQSPPKPPELLDFEFPPDLSSLQKQDVTLKHWFERVTDVEGVQQNNPSCLDDATYMVKEGLLYQKKGKTETLALPQQFRQRVMEMGHSIPWAGHMAFQKTLNRIASRFVWPGMYTQVSHFCASCETCQLTSAKGVVRAQLQFLPIIDTPFERIGHCRPTREKFLRPPLHFGYLRLCHTVP